jgi:predicted RNA-binding protein Jag
MKSIVVEAATVLLAIEGGLTRLKTTKDKVIIKVLREEKKGLFEMKGASVAKIMMMVKKG